MKKLIGLLSLIILTSGIVRAQKYAFVDTEYILNNIPSYKAAQEKLDNLSKQWEKEVSDKYAEIDKMYKAYQNEVVLLTQEMKKKREDEIVNKEKTVKELQKKILGLDGNLLKKKKRWGKRYRAENKNCVL